MTARRVKVMLAVNDSRGLETGRCHGIEVYDSGDICCRLEAHDLERGVAFAWLFPKEPPPPRFRLHGSKFVFTGRQCHVGNLAWDEVYMAEAEARRLVTYAARAGFVQTEWTDGWNVEGEDV